MKSSPIVVTGGAGFIGSNFILQWLAVEPSPVINLDRLTYAGNPANLESVSADPRYRFVQGDIGDPTLVQELLQRHQPRAIVHFAAESHVDRSIHGPDDFVRTNINGTSALLQEARAYWNDLAGEHKSQFRFLQISTDEVYGSLKAEDPPFRRDQRLCAQQPIFGVESFCRPSGSRLPSHLRTAHYHHELLQQLWTISVSGKVDSAGDPERLRGQTNSGVRRRKERS